MTLVIWILAIVGLIIGCLGVLSVQRTSDSWGKEAQELFHAFAYLTIGGAVIMAAGGGFWFVGSPLVRDKLSADLLLSGVGGILVVSGVAFGLRYWYDTHLLPKRWTRV